MEQTNGQSTPGLLMFAGNVPRTRVWGTTGGPDVCEITHSGVSNRQDSIHKVSMVIQYAMYMQGLDDQTSQDRHVHTI